MEKSLGRVILQDANKHAKIHALRGRVILQDANKHAKILAQIPAKPVIPNVIKTPVIKPVQSHVVPVVPVVPVRHVRHVVVVVGAPALPAIPVIPAMALVLFHAKPVIRVVVLAIPVLLPVQGLPVMNLLALDIDIPATSGYT